MKKIILFGICIGFLALVLGGCANTGPAKIELSTDSYDLGDIDPSGGIRIEEFYVKNTGGEILKINSVSTSCGCTQAMVESNELQPGEETKLIVEYDPSVHPGLVGRIKRIIYIKSNDPFNEEVELELVGNSLAEHDEAENIQALEGQ